MKKLEKIEAVIAHLASLEELRAEDLEYEWRDRDFQNSHYSKKGGHAARSRQTPRKISARR